MLVLCTPLQVKCTQIILQDVNNTGPQALPVSVF